MVISGNHKKMVLFFVVGFALGAISFYGLGYGQGIYDGIEWMVHYAQSYIDLQFDSDKLVRALYQVMQAHPV